jgi:hypothetical protein
MTDFRTPLENMVDTILANAETLCTNKISNKNVREVILHQLIGNRVNTIISR